MTYSDQQINDMIKKFLEQKDTPKKSIDKIQLVTKPKNKRTIKNPAVKSSKVATASIRKAMKTLAKEKQLIQKAVNKAVMKRKKK